MGDEVASESNVPIQNNQQQQQQPSRMESFIAITKSLVIRAIIIYFVTSFFRRPQAQQPQRADSTSPNGRVLPSWNFFENGTMFDIYFYVSEDYEFKKFSDPSSLVWFQDGLIYGDWYSGKNHDGSYSKSTKIKASEKLQNNGTIYLHTYVVKTGKSPDPAAGDEYAGFEVAYNRRQLNKFKKVRYQKTQNLLTGTSEKSAEEIAKAEVMSKEIVNHWHPNLTVNIIVDQTNWVKGTIPPPLDEHVTFLPIGHSYLPILFVNDYWNMLRDYQPINTTTPVLDLTITFQPLSLFKFQLYASQGMRNKWTSSMFGETLSGAADEQDEDQDSLKETLLETNPYLLAVTFIVSILHTVFELLAFKNDIQFWRERKSLEGLSVRSVFFAVFQSLIVLLYVLDNETNFMIRMSCFIGLGIELWKIQKVVNVTINYENKLFGFLPRIWFTDKGSYIESSTRQYDNLAFKYLGWLCFPLLVSYGCYSLLYQEHRGWYSFTLNMLYGFLLTFGFIMMTPQLFINYKLKSVAHLPWRMMTYKFLNTFIDDIFAFVIKMPTMYRLGVFRDDIVFFIFLYQRWIYKVDMKRVNEFGFSAEMLEEKNKNQSVTNSNDSAIEAIDEASEPRTNKKDD
ncbi:CLUMA_CG003264, isoform A [Clunio marinus]|uniref:CLUMA_CG003264, isoform A n=1 Tax=Clunio marinus TaxID=568069 RepID=A0A1J1HNG3_9DIPT|nr:CLUMA_CG003264, isoform A [Clunio marinus]